MEALHMLSRQDIISGVTGEPGVAVKKADSQRGRRSCSYSQLRGLLAQQQQQCQQQARARQPAGRRSAIALKGEMAEYKLESSNATGSWLQGIVAQQPASAAAAVATVMQPAAASVGSRGAAACVRHGSCTRLPAV
jgi:hypothetical protein